VRSFLSLILLAAITACVPSPPPTAVATGPELAYENARASAKEKKYTKAIAAYRKIAADSPQSPLAAEALFEIAYLQAFYDNPQKDYELALTGFDEFLKRFPHHEKAPDAKNWRVLLKTILDMKKENEQLHESIEELNKLDVRHEEQRKEK
jgi:outer membrane protein assembly factor BamD (BamD/ComL family)